jgi:hypothetical protein
MRWIKKDLAWRYTTMPMRSWCAIKFTGSECACISQHSPSSHAEAEGLSKVLCLQRVKRFREDIHNIRKDYMPFWSAFETSEGAAYLGRRDLPWKVWPTLEGVTYLGRRDLPWKDLPWEVTDDAKDLNASKGLSYPEWHHKGLAQWSQCQAQGSCECIGSHWFNPLWIMQ